MFKLVEVCLNASRLSFEIRSLICTETKQLAELKILHNSRPNLGS